MTHPDENSRPRQAIDIRAVGSTPTAPTNISFIYKRLQKFQGTLEEQLGITHTEKKDLNRGRRANFHGMLARQLALEC